MADCPKCGDLLADPKSCRCGWKSRARREPNEPEPLEHIPCAHETCDLSARVKIHTETGWAKLCIPHYVMHFDLIAQKHFTELGLDRGTNETREAWRKRVMAHMKMKPKTFADAVKSEDEWAA